MVTPAATLTFATTVYGRDVAERVEAALVAAGAPYERAEVREGVVRFWTEEARGHVVYRALSR